MCRIDDCDRSEFMSTSYQRAAKIHRCYECGRDIAKGERYRRTFTVTEGSAGTFLMCGHCEAAAGWLLRECGGFMFDQVAEELAEHAEEYPHVADALAPLVAGIRARWQCDGALMAVPSVPEATTRELVAT